MASLVHSMLSKIGWTIRFLWFTVFGLALGLAIGLMGGGPHFFWYVVFPLHFVIYYGFTETCTGTISTPHQKRSEVTFKYKDQVWVLPNAAVPSEQWDWRRQRYTSITTEVKLRMISGQPATATFWPKEGGTAFYFIRCKDDEPSNWVYYEAASTLFWIFWGGGIPLALGEQEDGSFDWMPLVYTYLAYLPLVLVHAWCARQHAAKGKAKLQDEVDGDNTDEESNVEMEPLQIEAESEREHPYWPMIRRILRGLLPVLRAIAAVLLSLLCPVYAWPAVLPIGEYMYRDYVQEAEGVISLRRRDEDANCYKFLHQFVDDEQTLWESRNPISLDPKYKVGDRVKLLMVPRKPSSALPREWVEEKRYSSVDSEEACACLLGFVHGLIMAFSILYFVIAICIISIAFHQSFWVWLWYPVSLIVTLLLACWKRHALHTSVMFQKK